MNALLDWLVDGVLIAALATVVAFVIPPNAPSQRYAYWWLVLAAILGLPFVPASTGEVGRTIAPMRDAVALPVHTAFVNLPVVPAFVMWLACALAAGYIVVRSLGLLNSLLRIRQLADASFALPPEYVKRFRAFRAAQAGSRRATLRVTTAFRGACAIGYRRPSILVSSALTERLNVDEVEAVVLHEYAHLQRYDDWACLVQAVIRALAGWHPAVWWVTRQLDIEREAACDRLVVQRTQSPVAYVRALIAAADLSLQGAVAMLHLAPGLTWSAGGFQARMRRLIEAPLTNRPVAWGSAAGAVLALVMVVMVTDRMPPLVVVTSGASADVREDAAFMNGNTVEGAVEHAIDAQSRAAAAVDVIGSESPSKIADRSSAQLDRVKRAARPSNLAVVSRTAGGTHSATPSIADHVAAAGTESAFAPSPEPQSAAPAATELDARPLTAMAPLMERPQDVETAGRGIGERAASLGSATGDVASRTGASIGRFFSRGSRAVAQRFQ
ncbi:MAG: M56 family metallopeptidase [Vicinamibacterales bacterium]